MREALKVGISGVRGVVGESLSPQVAASFAQAFGTFVGQGPVVVGRDTRPSGPMIEKAVIAGLQSVGCRPILVDIAPTPTILILTNVLGARGGIAITASHNPSAWNALKFISPKGRFLDSIHAEELFDVYHQQDFVLVSEAEIPRVSTQDYPLREHFRRILDYVDNAAIRKSRFKVAVDCCNGVGALHTVPFLEDLLGCEVVPLFDAPTGAFERDPEPLPQHLDALREAVAGQACHVGFAQDPDGDRLALVDEKGNALIEDLTLALAAEQVLTYHETGPVAINLPTSKSVEDVVRKHGVDVSRTRIGEINVTEEMLRIGAVVGGENNGGVIVPALHPCRDSYIGMALILERMALTGQPLSGLRAAIPRYHLIKEKIPIGPGQAPGVLRSIRQAYARHRLSFLDGIFVDLEDSWVHIRRSNTEPVMRITTEAPRRDKATRLSREARARVLDALEG